MAVVLIVAAIIITVAPPPKGYGPLGPMAALAGHTKVVGHGP